MVSRALIVMLLVLNLGVATWWALRPAVSPRPPRVPTGAPRLVLLREAPVPRSVSNAATMDPAVRGPGAATTPTAAGRCVAFGPFADDVALARASATLQPQVARLHLRQVPASGHGWRVWLPPLPGRDGAQTMAARIAAAGFEDYYIVAAGAEANSIALGRYGNPEAAQRRQAALQAAGFPAQSAALGGAGRWIDVATASTFDVDNARARIGAPTAQPMDCAQLP